MAADTYGTAQDIFRYSGRAILYEGADKKHDWIQTGPMILIGYSWKLLDAPAPGDFIPNNTETGNPGTTNTADDLDLKGKIGRASCRERVCLYV